MKMQLELHCIARTALFSTSDKILQLNNRYLSKYLTFSWSDCVLGFWNSCFVVTKFHSLLQGCKNCRVLQFIARMIKTLFFLSTMGREWSKFAILKMTSHVIKDFPKYSCLTHPSDVPHSALPHLSLSFPAVKIYSAVFFVELLLFCNLLLFRNISLSLLPSCCYIRDMRYPCSSPGLPVWCYISYISNCLHFLQCGFYCNLLYTWISTEVNSTFP